jgi:hypothetical protein
MAEVPDYADEVSYGSIFKISERPSQFVPGMMAVVRIVECPSCHETYPDPGAIAPVRCRCGMCMQFHFKTGGAAIWREPTTGGAT